MEHPQPRPPDPARDLAVVELEARLGQPFSNPGVALAAITHKSFVNEHRGEGLTDNERLEFLGDAVLDLAVSHRLMERFPVAREGELSKIRAALVDEAGLARMARTLELGSLLRLGRGEELTGGRDKSSLLADAMEAVVAALYLGGGLEPVLALLDRFLGEAFARAAAGTLDRDYKTQLQEVSQSRVRASPRYRVVGEHGPDHSKVFDVEAELKGEVIGRGTGRSKKDAEQAAAKVALETLSAKLCEEKPAAHAKPVEAPGTPGGEVRAPAPTEEAPEPPSEGEREVERELASGGGGQAPAPRPEESPALRTDESPAPRAEESLAPRSEGEAAPRARRPRAVTKKRAAAKATAPRKAAATVRKPARKGTRAKSRR